MNKIPTFEAEIKDGKLVIQARAHHDRCDCVPCYTARSKARAAELDTHPSDCKCNGCRYRREYKMVVDREAQSKAWSRLG